MTDTAVRPVAPPAHPWVRPDRVHRNAYLDPGLFAEELDRIFNRVWIYVAHESELSRPGDYRTTTIGRQPVIVTRDRAGAIHVLMNRCTHRAATVCQAASGNSATFRCEYHGWTFRNDGELVAPTFSGGYDPADFSVADFALAQAPRVDTYRGLIFASLAGEGESLREHLGRAAEYIDLAVDLAPAGTIRLGAGTHRYNYRGNWKLQSENGVDGYHPNFVHRAFFETSGLGAGLFGPGSNGRAGSLGRGHAVLDFRSMMEPLMRQRLATPEGARAVDRLAERLGDRDRATEVFLANGTQGYNLLVFPNLQIIGCQLRVIHPRAVDHTEVDLHPYLHDGATDEENAARLRVHEAFYGPSGGGGPDDVEMFDRVATGLAVQSVEWLPLLRGLRRELVDGEARWGHITDEQPQRGFYHRWLELMA
ncbi:MAG TPA: Rieske 2Fe-2S domain-containing protein [Pseudonocardia sp.]|nr:Rieske 2Fe-2S domain-containing protein [Pseudonocardia sp.]